MKVRDVIKFVERDGWQLVRTRWPRAVSSCCEAGDGDNRRESCEAGWVEVMRFAAVFERTSTGWSAYAPDLPGLGVAGDTIDETRQLLREAIEMHIEDLHATGQPIPSAASQTDYVEVALPAYHVTENCFLTAGTYSSL
jgi:predicted RNase H-like HicB family nuclease